MAQSRIAPPEFPQYIYAAWYDLFEQWLLVHRSSAVERDMDDDALGIGWVGGLVRLVRVRRLAFSM